MYTIFFHICALDTRTHVNELENIDFIKFGFVIFNEMYEVIFDEKSFSISLNENYVDCQLHNLHINKL